MSKRVVRTSLHTPSPQWLTTARKLCQQALDLLACLYMLVVIVALPLYQKQSYAQIGTDKRNFFNEYLLLHSKLLIGLALIWLVLSLISYIMTHGKDFSLRQLGTTLLSVLREAAVTDLFVAGYFMIVLLSGLFTDYKDLALLGSSGWTMGTLMQLSLASGYFLISRFWKKRLWIPGLMLPVSFIVLGLGYLNRFNIWPIAMEYSENPQFLSLAGNINWYCGYLVTILFAAVYLHWASPFQKPLHQWLLRGYLFVGYAALITNGSSSGVLSLLVILLVLFLLSVSDGRSMEHFFETALIFSLSCLFTLGIRLLFPDAITYQETTNNLFTCTPLPAILTLLSFAGFTLLRRLSAAHKYPARLFRGIGFLLGTACIAGILLYIILLVINTQNPGSIGPLSDYSFFTFSNEWGSRRGITWKAGYLTWAEQPFFRKLIGVGPDCMVGYLYRDSSAGLLTMLQTVWPTTTLSNAHNEWLTILANLGLLGLLSFAGLILSAVWTFLKKGKDTTDPYAALIGACGLSVLAYTIHNIVSFQQVLNEPAMFVILGIGAAYFRRKQR